jgi:hypothetical protein
VRAELYLFQYTFDIKYRADKNNIVPNILSRLIRLKHDSNSLFKDKNILEDAINKYYYYNVRGWPLTSCCGLSFISGVRRNRTEFDYCGLFGSASAVVKPNPLSNKKYLYRK